MPSLFICAAACVWKVEILADTLDLTEHFRLKESLQSAGERARRSKRPSGVELRALEKKGHAHQHREQEAVAGEPPYTRAIGRGHFASTGVTEYQPSL